MKLTYPAPTGETALVAIPVEAVPLVAGQLAQLEKSYLWATEADWQAGRQMAIDLQEQMMSQITVEPGQGGTGAANSGALTWPPGGGVAALLGETNTFTAAQYMPRVGIEEYNPDKVLSFAGNFFGVARDANYNFGIACNLYHTGVAGERWRISNGAAYGGAGSLLLMVGGVIIFLSGYGATGQEIDLIQDVYIMNGQIYAPQLRVNPATPNPAECYVDSNGFLKRAPV